MDKLLDQLIHDLKELTKEIGEKKAKRLDLPRFERIVKRLAAFMEDCQECKNYLSEMKTDIEYLKSKHGRLEKQDIKEHLANG